MATGRVLTVDALENLRRCWEAIGAPVSQRLRRGLEEHEMDALTHPLGLHVPGEARTWWMWHDGADFERGQDGRITGTGFLALPLANAVREAELMRRLANEVAGNDAEATLWRPSWLPISTNLVGGLIVVDCAGRENETTPIYYVEWPSGPEMFEPRTQTFGEMVCWWLDAFDTGAFGFDREQGRWIYSYDRVDPIRELTRLV